MRRVLLSTILVLLLLGSFAPLAVDLVVPEVAQANGSGTLAIPYKAWTGGAGVTPGDGTNGCNLQSVCGSDADYTTAHDLSVGISSSINQRVGQQLGFYVRRGVLSFDTSVLPDDAVVTGLELSIYVSTDQSLTDFDIVVVDGRDINDKYTLGDYGDLLDETISYGSINTGMGGFGGRESIILTSGAYDWIDAEGITSMGLRSSRDISVTQPTGHEYVEIMEYGEYGRHIWLYVSYTSNYGTVTVWANDADVDCYWRKDNASYAVAHDYPTGLIQAGNHVQVGQRFLSAKYYIMRGGLQFDTSCLPDAAIVSSAWLRTSMNSDFSDVDFDLTIVSGADINTPPVTADYHDLLDETESWGSINTSEISFPGVVDITMTGGLPNISKTGTTKLGLRSSSDINSVYGEDQEFVGLYSVEASEEKWQGSPGPGDLDSPKLTITYSSFTGTVQTDDATSIMPTTATLNGELLDDGGETTVYCYFEWGDTQSMTNDTSQQVVSEGSSFSIALSSLTRYEKYYFRAAAWVVDKGIAYGVMRSFISLAEYPVVETFSVTDITASSATLHGYLSNDGGHSCEWRFRWGLSSGAYQWATTWTGSLTSDTAFERALYSLEPGTTYFHVAQCQNSRGVGGGSEVSFDTPLVNPAITTRPATSVSVTTAILNAYVSDDGGEACYVRFQYGKTTGYGTDTSWVYPYGEGQSVYKQIMSLDVDDTYHFRAQIYNAKNGVGSPMSGADATFDTSASVGSITNFSVTAFSGTQILIVWLSGTGSQSTMVRYKTGSYPSTTSDGDVAYFDLGTNTTLSGLTPGVTYYFSAWGHAPDNYWSASPAQDVATTNSIGAAAILLPPPDEPSWWFLNPSTTKIQNMPGFAIIQWQAETLGVPEGSWACIMAMMFAAFAGGIILVWTRSSTVALWTVGVICFAASMAGLVPLWILFAIVMISVSIMYFVPAGRGV